MIFPCDYDNGDCVEHAFFEIGFYKPGTFPAWPHFSSQSCVVCFFFVTLMPLPWYSTDVILLLLLSYSLAFNTDYTQINILYNIFKK